MEWHLTLTASDSEKTMIWNSKSECFDINECFNRFKWMYPSNGGARQISFSISHENIHCAIQSGVSNCVRVKNRWRSSLVSLFLKWNFAAVIRRIHTHTTHRLSVRDLRRLAFEIANRCRGRDARIFQAASYVPPV